MSNFCRRCTVYMLALIGCQTGFCAFMSPKIYLSFLYKVLTWFDGLAERCKETAMAWVFDV